MVRPAWRILARVVLHCGVVYNWMEGREGASPGEITLFQTERPQPLCGRSCVGNLEAASLACPGGAGLFPFSG